MANRIGKLQMLTQPPQRQHVPTKKNPADICRRGATPSLLADHLLWGNGPGLTDKEYEWRAENASAEQTDGDAKDKNVEDYVANNCLYNLNIQNSAECWLKAKEQRIVKVRKIENGEKTLSLFPARDTWF